MLVLGASAFCYHLQAKEGMYFVFRPLVITLNICTIIWATLLVYFRYRNSGRACSGDFLDGYSKPANYSTVYLVFVGHWYFWFINAHFLVFVICKMLSMVVSNKLEEEL